MVDFQSLGIGKFRHAGYRGVYTPPSVDKNSIEYPSYNGGSDWGSLAVAEKDGILVAKYNDMANFDRLVPRDVADKLGSLPVDIRGSAASTNGVSPQAEAPYAVRVNAGWVQPWTGMMCKQPPYGGIKAIDLKTGKTLWSDKLPGGGQANPMTFEARGQQYLVITDGGHHFMKTPIDGSIIAYALPPSASTSTPKQPASQPEQQPEGAQQ